MRRLQPFFPKVRDRARSDDCKMLSGIIYVKRYGLRWQDAASVTRREQSAPIISALKPWLETQLSRIPRKSLLAEDIRYTLAHWPGLIRFIDDGTLDLDTNPVEKPRRRAISTSSYCRRRLSVLNSTWAGVDWRT